MEFPWELLIVDNGTEPDTAALCVKAAEWMPSGTLRYLREPVPGLHSGRHRGAEEARAELLLFVDDDIEASATLLSATAEAFTDPDVGIVGGPSLPRYERDPPQWIEATWVREIGKSWCGYLSLLDFGAQPCDIDPIFVWGLNFGIRRELLYRLRGFHPDALPWELRRYRGDGETGLSLKARASGIRARYHPAALVYHEVPAGRLTEDYFLRRSFLQGISDSFTAIRAYGGIAPPEPLEARIKARARMLRRRLDGTGPDPLGRRLKHAHDEGFRFHQREAAGDAGLLAWVLRSDYMGCAVPGPNTPANSPNPRHIR